MKKVITLTLFITTTFLVNHPSLAQAPIIIHDTGDYLTEVEIVKPDKKPISPVARKAANNNSSYKKTSVVVRKPILKPSKILARPTSKQTTRPAAKPESLSKGYQPQMSITKTIPVKAAPRSIQAKRIVSKPVYVAPKITDIKYPAASPVQQITKRKPIIVIDPGHGGKDRGTMGDLGTKEKDITLSYSLALKRELDRTGRYKVILTRYDDRFIELPQRVNIARKTGGDVLISIHADSNPNKNTKGFSIYTLSNNRRDREAEKLLAKSGREEVVRGANLRSESKDVREAIIDFAQGSSKEVSDDFAQTVGKHLGKRIQALRKHNRQGSLAVLTGADVPSLLIELGYLSNRQEERLLKTEAHKQKIVTSITNAINEYFSKFNMVF